MSKRPALRPGKRPAPPPAKKNWWMVIVIGILVIGAAAGIAIWSTRGSDSVSEGSVGTDNVSTSAETQPVTATGESLAQQSESGEDHSVDGKTPPTLQGFTFDGSPIEITPGGRAKMVVFLAHWCPHCNREIPRLLAWKESGGIPADLDIIGVSTAATADRDNYPPSRWIQTIGWAWPVMADSSAQQAALAYGLGGYPTFVIVGSDGKVKVRYSGEIEVTDLAAMVATALAA